MTYQWFTPTFRGGGRRPVDYKLRLRLVQYTGRTSKVASPTYLFISFGTVWRELHWQKGDVLKLGRVESPNPLDGERLALMRLPSTTDGRRGRGWKIEQRGTAQVRLAVRALGADLERKVMDIVGLGNDYLPESVVITTEGILEFTVRARHETKE